MIKLLIALMCSFSPLRASTLFAPDSDTALLLQILGTEIEATVGILEMINISSETMNKIEEVHTTADDLYTESMQAEYYANSLTAFPDNLEKGRSMVTLRNNLYDAKALYDAGSRLTLGYDVLKTSNDHAANLALKNMEKNKLDHRLATQYLKMTGSANKTSDGTIYGARASALGTLKLVNISNSISLLNYQTLIRNDYILSRERQQLYDEYNMQMQWGMIPQDMSFEQFSPQDLKLKNDDRKI